MSSLLTLGRLSLSSPDGRQLFSNLTISLGAERIGLVGRNGSGKSTLLRAIAGEVEPTSGSIAVAGKVGVLRQVAGTHPGSLSDMLGASEGLARLDRIEHGSGTAVDFERADWLLPARIEDALAKVGLKAMRLDRELSTLSGGERARVALARLLSEEPDILLLDEPTNDLDAGGRMAISHLLENWRGAAIIASHDRALLENVDRVVALSPIEVTIVSGGWSAWEAYRDAARHRAELVAERAEQELRAARRAGQDARERQARRDSGGRAYAASGSAPKISMGLAKRRAEATTGRYERLAASDIAQAAESREIARRTVERVTPLSFGLPSTNLPANRLVLSLENVVLNRGGRRLFGPINLVLKGPERITVAGPNGVGKSSLLKLITGEIPATQGTVKTGVPFAYLDQQVGLLRDELSLLDNLKLWRPRIDDHEAHRALAQFAFRNNDALRQAGSLSGGERLRAGLACVMAADTPPQLLLLDEPTNHLDVTSIEELESALQAYDGVLILVSHDPKFVTNVGICRTIELSLKEHESPTSRPL